MPLLVAEAGLELVAVLGSPWVVAEVEVQRSMVDELHVEQGGCLEQGLTGKGAEVQGRGGGRYSQLAPPLWLVALGAVC